MCLLQTVRLQVLGINNTIIKMKLTSAAIANGLDT